MEPPMDTNSTVAEEVRALMGRRRTTQGELAEVIGVSQGTMSRRLAGTMPFTVPELDSIAAYFDVPITDLLGSRTGSMPTPTDSQDPPHPTLPFIERELQAV